ncbi:MAG TPA: tetratricopeptide repeat protein [Terriglobia bacterium]|nr:tetratricopeptide repeat protein [Terriglobia bacterium]
MSDQRRRTRRLLWLLAAGGVVAVVLVAWLKRGRGPQPSPENPFPLPSYSESRFLNTGSEARYIGTAACVACHPGNHRSFLLTAHSRSLAEVEPNAEPPDGSFNHQLSGRSYRVYRRDNQLRHEEVLSTAKGQEITRVDLPIRYRIGSGHFTRTYLVELDGFLHESPITWYASRKQWDMSPGYDFPKHWGFDRPVSANCVACHAGRVEAADGTLHRIVFHEQTIGCENCHGPGSRHEALRKNRDPVPGEEDVTIVNPGKLSRPLLEAVCSECHLSGAATVTLRGRHAGDFRPGMPLTDFRVDYRFDGGKELMTVAGHIAQLRQSTCYQQSADLSCLTCHDPHAHEKPKDPAAFYRQKCLSCHTVQACGLGQAQRRAKDAIDNCLACHMPRGDTEIPHIAFTNHRIERRPKPRPADLVPGGALVPDVASEQAPELVLIDDVPQLAPLEQRRNLGLAYFAASGNPVYVRYGYVGAFRERAMDLLAGVDAAGLHDPETAVALAQLYWKKDRDLATTYARRALQATDISAKARISSLLLLAGAAMQDRQFDAAIRWLEEVVQRQRAANDWYFIGLCNLDLNQPSRALPALQKSLAIRPDSSAVHARLAQAYRRLGNVRRANEHQEKARWLFQERQD